jgi:glycosyltransferase involved in cell wall biosynthesis
VSGVAGPPELAVIIGAYHRSEYLPVAVQSVLAQTLPRDAFEVLVVTDSSDPDLRRGLERSGVRVRTDPQPRIGRWLLDAVAETTAPLVAFLDDDDEFEPDRLAAVRDAFRAHPDTVFYRNRVRMIDRAGAPVPETRWNPLTMDRDYDRSGSRWIAATDRAGRIALFRGLASLTFNSSSMVVHRSIFEGDAGRVFAGTQLPDLALAVLGAVAPGALYLDAARRTRFRNAEGSATHNYRWLREAADSHGRLAAYPRSHGFPELAAWLDEHSVHYDRLYRGEAVVEGVRSASSRREVADGAIEYLRFLGRHRCEWSASLNVWAAPLYASGYVIAPGLTRRLAIARPTAARA